MSGIDDLNAAVASLKTAVDANTTSTNNEITVVNQVIATLQAGGLTDAQAEALATQLQTSVTNLSTSQAALDAESKSIQVPPPAKP